MSDAIGLGRVVVVDGGEGGRRVLRAIRELVRLGRAEAAVAVHGPLERHVAFLREADEAFEGQDRREALAAARPGTVWIGKASPSARAELASWCAENDVRLVGPSAEVLRRIAAPGGLTVLAREIGIPLAGPVPAADARVVEVVVARDVEGRTRVVGLGDPALRLGDAVVFAESSSSERWSEAERSVAALAVRACEAAGWVGVVAVQLALEPSGRPRLIGLDPAAGTAPAVEAVSGVDLVRLALSIAAGEAVGAASLPGAALAVGARIVPRDPEGDLGGGGRVERLRLPSDPVLRVEAEVDEGDSVRARRGRGHGGGDGRLPAGSAGAAGPGAGGLGRAGGRPRHQQGLAGGALCAPGGPGRGGRGRTHRRARRPR